MNFSELNKLLVEHLYDITAYFINSTELIHLLCFRIDLIILCILLIKDNAQNKQFDVAPKISK